MKKMTKDDLEKFMPDMLTEIVELIGKRLQTLVDEKELQFNAEGLIFSISAELLKVCGINVLKETKNKGNAEFIFKALELITERLKCETN